MERFIAGMKMLIANPQIGIKTKHPELRIKICEALIDWAQKNPDEQFVNVIINGKRFEPYSVFFPTCCIIELEQQLGHRKIESMEFT